MKFKYRVPRRFWLILVLIFLFSNIIAERPTAFVYMTASSSIPEDAVESLDEVLFAIYDGLIDSNRFNDVILLYDSITDCSEYDIISNSCLSNKCAKPILVSAHINNLSNRLISVNDSISHNDVSISISLRYVDALDGTLINYRHFVFPKVLIGVHMTNLLYIASTVDQAIKSHKNAIVKEIKKSSIASFPYTASLLNYHCESNDKPTTLNIKFDPVDKFSNGDKVDIIKMRTIGREKIFKSIGEATVITLLNDSTALCEVKKGASLIKESFDEGQSIIVREKISKH